MADFELEDLQGNRYRLRRGSGPGLYHPENLCTGGNFDAERLLGHFSTSNIDDSFNHFYFEVLSKLDDRPSCPRQALTKAIAANYLTLEKIDTARAVDDEVPDDRPFLRVQIENALRQIVEGERREAAMHQRQMDKESTVMKGLIYTGAFMTGIGSSAWGLAVQVKELSDVINPFVKMQHHAKALRDAWESDNFADTYAETYLSGEKRELVEAIGFDPSQITQQQIDEAISMTDLVLNDETLRDILYRFVKDYAEAQHAIEITEVAGSGAFELILTIIVAAVTGGAGVVAAVGRKMHLVRKFNKVGDLLADFAKATKRIKNRKNAFNGKNTGKADFKNFEVVDYQTRKTDSRGPHRDTDSQSREDSAPKNKDTVFSGHGSYEPSRGSVVVPEGTSITVYSKPGATITNDLGMEIEKGTDLSRVYKERYMPGDELPDYMLHSPDGLDLTGSPVTVTQDTPLSELLKPNMGECHWAACTYNSQAPTSNLVYDSDGVIDESLEDYVTIYNK